MGAIYGKPNYIRVVIKLTNNAQEMWFSEVKGSDSISLFVPAEPDSGEMPPAKFPDDLVAAIVNISNGHGMVPPCVQK